MISREEGKKKLVMAIPLIPLLFMTLMSRSFEPGTFMGENGSTLCLAIAFALLVINYAISKPNVKSLPTIIDAFENGGKNCLSVGIACGMAGIIAGVVTMTGLGQVLIGAIVGLSAVLLTHFGNPANMGFCIACFLRDISGAVGLHSAAKVQYVRPEIIGLVLGAFIMSVASKEFKRAPDRHPLCRKAGL